MKTAIKRSALFCALYWASCCALPMPCMGYAASVYEYPIVMRGPKAVWGAPVRGFAAYRWQSGRWHVVPIQVDEVNARGDYVLEGGLPFTKNTDDGLFDANDEIVIAGEDLGAEFSATDIDASIKRQAQSLWKLSVSRPSSRGAATLGCLLVVVRKDGAEPIIPGVAASSDVAVFDVASKEVSTDLYRYQFNLKSPALLGEVFLKKDKQEIPVFSDARFVMPLRTPFFMPDLTIDAQDFSSTVESWRVGPLRSIVAVGVQYKAFLSLLHLHLFSELVFYKNRFVIPTVIEFVFDPTKLLGVGSGIAYSLRFPPGQGWTVSSNLPRLPVGGLRSELEAQHLASQYDLFEAKGASPAGAFLARVSVAPEARRVSLPPYLLLAPDFSDPVRKKDYPWLSDLAGDLGLFVDFSQVPKGTYDFGLDLLLSSKADEGFTDYGSVDFRWHSMPL